MKATKHIEVSVFIFLLLAGSSCATVQRWWSADGMTSTERQAYYQQRNDESARLQREREANEAEQLERQRSVLKVGTSYDTFAGAYGSPDTTEMIDGVLHAHYRTSEGFKVFQFKKNKLVGWSTDTLATERAYSQKAERERQEAENQRLQSQIQSQREAEKAQYWRQFQEQSARNIDRDKQREHEEKLQQQQQTQRRSLRESGGQCLGAEPVLDYNCRAVCVNGEWSTICNGR